MTTIFFSYRIQFSFGEVAEWFKAHAWKACKPFKGFGGSNPPLRQRPNNGGASKKKIKNVHQNVHHATLISFLFAFSLLVVFCTEFNSSVSSVDNLFVSDCQAETSITFPIGVGFGHSLNVCELLRILSSSSREADSAIRNSDKATASLVCLALNSSIVLSSADI